MAGLDFFTNRVYLLDYRANISEYTTQSAKELLAESYVAYSNGSQDEYVLKVMEYCGIL